MKLFGLDDAVRVLPNGSLHKIRDPEKYDLIIVDEAHKFRNDTADGYDLLQKLCKTRTRHRLPDDTFAKKRVILISATPLNNRPADIRNQVLLFQDGKDSTVIGNLQHFFAQQIKAYDIAINRKKTPDKREAQAAVARIYKLIREQVVQPLTVRRTRTDLVSDARWKADLDAQCIVFPHVEKPRPILYQLDAALDALYDRTIQMLTLAELGGLTYNRYRAIAFLATPKLREKYERPDLVAEQLAKIMKTLLVMPVVRANFDANVPLADAEHRKDDYRILISTEVLAEGVNLHRAHVVVNYDTPWNSTRLMQRIGRVNRIGCTAAKIHIFNFYPTAQVDSQIYSQDEEVSNFGLFDKDIEEDRDERLAFLSELRDFKDAHADEFRRIRNLALRARCGRKDAPHAGQSFVFIRDQRRDAFYRVTDSIAEMGFVEMAKAFRAEIAEVSVPLHDAHHQHVQSALADFSAKLTADAVSERAVDHTLPKQHHTKL
jgi:hypothetical protein